MSKCFCEDEGEGRGDLKLFLQQKSICEILSVRRYIRRVLEGSFSCGTLAEIPHHATNQKLHRWKRYVLEVL